MDTPSLRVAEFPRPPAIEAEPRRIRIVLGGETIADTTAAYSILETTHPPTYYLPPAAFRPGALTRAPGSSMCEWKGAAIYHTLHGGGLSRPGAG